MTTNPHLESARPLLASDDEVNWDLANVMLSNLGVPSDDVITEFFWLRMDVYELVPKGWVRAALSSNPFFVPPSFKLLDRFNRVFDGEWSNHAVKEYVQYYIIAAFKYLRRHLPKTKIISVPSAVPFFGCDYTATQHQIELLTFRYDTVQYEFDGERFSLLLNEYEKAYFEKRMVDCSIWEQGKQDMQNLFFEMGLLTDFKRPGIYVL